MRQLVPEWTGEAERIRKAASALIPAPGEHEEGRGLHSAFDRAVQELHGFYEEEEGPGWEGDESLAPGGPQCVRMRAEPDEDMMHALAMQRGVFDVGRRAAMRDGSGLPGRAPTWSAPPSPPSATMPVGGGGSGQAVVIFTL